MTDLNHDDRPPYLAAALVALAILAVYVWSLAPTVTFWDAGEFIAAGRILGIPHPPGTPLFVLLMHVWGLLVPFGEYAWRINLFSAVLSAAGAGCWFLVAHETLRRATLDTGAQAAALIRFGGAAAAAVMGAFAFTTWQNSNETEVYMVATLTIAATAWLILRWRARRGTPAAARLLVLIVYLGGVSIGNHLLALLAGPGLVAFLIAELRLHPAADPAERRRERGQVAVVAGVWALLVGMGLGNTTLILVGGAAFAVAAVLAARGGALPFALVTLAIALVGVTPYLFLYLRAAEAPIINQADPSTWQALLDVIRRAQYPVRTPLDNPMQLHGPGNTGRSLEIIGLQLANYWQYFDWQWARSILAQAGDVPLRTLVTLMVVWLGIQGARTQYRSDRAAFWMMLGLWLVTGLGLVAYMNFKPGFSIGYDRFPDPADHEVRERDYFFVASFVTWGVWAGLGLARLAAAAMARAGGGARRWVAGGVLALALLPVALNAGPASRRHSPDARLAADFAYNLLNSVPPYGVLFTFGDNDTFPLWWAQEVEGIRRDVVVVCLALAETSWYMRQLRDNPIRPFERDRAPAIWRDWPATTPDWPLHTMSDDEIASAVPQLIGADTEVAFGPYRVMIPARTPFYGKDFLVVRVLQENFGRRPIAWAITATGSHQGLDPLLVQRGLALWVDPEPPDTLDLSLDFHPSGGAALDLPLTARLLTETYRYAEMMERGPGRLDPTSRSMAGALAVPFTQMASAADRRGDAAAAFRWMEGAARLTDAPGVREALEAARARLPSTGQ
jgi:uncharacterized membrane protein YhaH (DUF805 family)